MRYRREEVIAQVELDRMIGLLLAWLGLAPFGDGIRVFRLHQPVRVWEGFFPCDQGPLVKRNDIAKKKV